VHADSSASLQVKVFALGVPDYFSPNRSESEISYCRQFFAKSNIDDTAPHTRLDERVQFLFYIVVQDNIDFDGHIHLSSLPRVENSRMVLTA
jgi:hypothetical protein